MVMLRDAAEDVPMMVGVLLKELGLDQVAKIYTAPDGKAVYTNRSQLGYEYVVDVKMEFSVLQKTMSEPMSEIVARFREKLEEIKKQIVAGPVFRELQGQLEAARQENRAQRTEIRRLRKFETHYTLSYEMVHGREQPKPSGLSVLEKTT